VLAQAFLPTNPEKTTSQILNGNKDFCFPTKQQRSVKLQVPASSATALVTVSKAELR